MTSVQHIPLTDMSLLVVSNLVQVIHYAVAQNRENDWLSDSDCAIVENLVQFQKMPFNSDTLHKAAFGVTCQISIRHPC
jgi:hypothetical protein